MEEMTKRLSLSWRAAAEFPWHKQVAEDSNHLKTPGTANLSLVVWGELSLSPSINTLQALLAKISPWAGYF